tara:strand:- start:35405 stop:36502 length:1098 start_codon:yes stop_codon:yes gene_type:complete
VPEQLEILRLIRLLRYLVDGDIDSAAGYFPDDKAARDSLLALLGRNQLGGYFHLLIKDGPLQSLLPAVEAAELEKAYLTQAERAHSHLVLLKQLQQCFERRNVPFVVLKGLYISHRFFGDISKRFMWDLDVLVHPEDLQLALEAAESMGLAPTAELPVDVTDPRWGIHAVELADQRGKVDIHIALRNLPGIHIDLDRQWRHARPYTIDGAPLPCASDEDTLFLCCLGLGTDMRRGRFNLRKVWDVYLMLRQIDGTIDWPAFLAQRDREGALQLVINTLAFVIFLIDCAEECPSVVAALQPHSRRLIIGSTEDALALYGRRQSTLHNHRLFSRLLPIPAWRYWLQWLVTAPARRLYYRGTGPKKKP